MRSPAVDPELVRRLADEVGDALARFRSDEREGVTVIYAARRRPLRIVGSDRPSAGATARTVARAVRQRRWRMCWCGPGAPDACPAIRTALRDLAAAGASGAIVVPLDGSAGAVRTLRVDDPGGEAAVALA